MQFRKDINGLRAFAVIAVMLFHFNSSWMPGGFAGVDVFFVISGFLMTGIIFRGIEQDNFSILKFYVARANRIVPALAVLCFVLLVFGWFYLIPHDYLALGEHVGVSLGFLSNIQYWHEAGYFDTASHEKWLLHTWSLSVEWQFYMLYPLVLVAMRRFMSLKAMKLIVLTGAIIGFIFCIIATYKWPDFAYYFLFTRAWEMMLGGVAYLYPRNTQHATRNTQHATRNTQHATRNTQHATRNTQHATRNTQHATRNIITYSLEWVGLILIVASFFLISKENPWPGYLALVPVMGTFLIIQAQRNDSFITGNIACQKIGSWSYSIYLWHWPLVVAIYYFSLSNIFIYPAIVLSILLGFISNKYIEKIKFRKNFENLFEYLKCKPIWMVLLVGFFGSATYATNGFIQHYPKLIQKISNQSQRDGRWKTCLGSWNKKQPECLYGKGPLGAIVIGDSHAEAMLGMIHRIFPKNKVLDWSISDCPTALGAYKYEKGVYNHGCGDFVAYALTQAKEKYPRIPIIIINRTSENLYGPNEPDRQGEGLTKFVGDRLAKKPQINMADSMLKTACQFAKTNPTYIVRPIPELKINVPKTRMRSILLTGKDVNITLAKKEYIERQRLAYKTQDEMQQKCGVKIIDPIPYLCSDGLCYGVKNGKTLYLDDDHLSESGADLISPAFKKALGINNNLP